MPSSLITNSNISTSSFINKNINSIVKPLSTGRVACNNNVGIIQTNLVDKNIELKNLELAPAYFQEYIEKQYELRVTIVDRKVFAVRIDTNEKIDWRKNKENIKYSKFKLPAKIIKKCNALMQKLNLKFGALDFIVNDRDEFYFLEINANGQWGWLEHELKLNISGAIMNYLMEME